MGRLVGVRRPLCLVCLVLIAIVALYYFICPPTLFSYGEVSGSRVYVSGIVYAKEFKKGSDGPNLYLYVKPDGLVSDNQLLPYDENFICVMKENTAEKIFIGSSVVLCGYLSEYEAATNPGQFDAKQYYAVLGISAKISKCEILYCDEQKKVLKESLWQMKCCIEDILDMTFDEESASVLKAMLLGDKSALEEDVKNLYMDAGILHILSISGLHISILGMGVLKMLKKIGVPIYPASGISGIFMILYGIMIGMPVSAIRAICMFVIRLVGQCLKRTYDIQTALLFSAALILFENPLYVYHAGFWLSFTAVAGVVFFRDCIVPTRSYESVKREPSFIRKMVFKCKKTCLDIFLTSLSISIFTLPIQLYFYFEISVYSSFLNILVVSTVGVVLLCGIISVLLYIVMAMLGALMPVEVMGMIFSLLDELVTGILKGYEKGAYILGQLPFNTWTPGQPKAWKILAFYALIALLILSCRDRQNSDSAGVDPHSQAKNAQEKGGIWPRFKVGILISGVMILALRDRSVFRITFLDVGQGDCICVEIPGGECWLFDGGSTSVYEVGENRIVPFLKSKGIKKLDAVFLSHEDKDHISGVEEILQSGEIKIELLVLPGTEEGRGFEKILTLAEERDILILWLVEGMQWESGGVNGLCLHPGSEFLSTDTNACSQVIYLSYQDFSVLLTGDVEGEGERALAQTLKEYGLTQVSVLKVAHHGSKYSTLEAFLSAIDAKTAVISSGENRYGHPHAETLERLLKDGSKVYRIDEQGSISLGYRD